MDEWYPDAKIVFDDANLDSHINPSIAEVVMNESDVTILRWSIAPLDNSSDILKRVVG
ncbi:MAG: hypothetical protein LBN22_06120 [Clostridiales Family XIII bacterium]|nr:hypothetical protein [Clostridiales Family XIII bacterium]